MIDSEVIDTLPRTAPPLTLENVFDVVKRVKSWRDLGTWLLGYLKGSKLNAIEREFDSDETRLKAMLESFLLGEGVYQPTWRGVIHALHEADEIAVARDILTNAEAVEGECVCVCVYSSLVSVSVILCVVFGNNVM